MNLYGSSVYDQFLEDPKCAECGEAAKQRCSKCKGEWYCSRECQIKKWKQHKEMCKILEQCKTINDGQYKEWVYWKELTFSGKKRKIILLNS